MKFPDDLNESRIGRRLRPEFKSHRQSPPNHYPAAMRFAIPLLFCLTFSVSGASEPEKKPELPAKEQEPTQVKEPVVKESAVEIG